MKTRRPHPQTQLMVIPTRATSARGQQGYILGTVLAAMVIGLIIITALLSLSFTTHRAAITQQRLSEERRAADGALETSVDLMRTGNPALPCDEVPATVAMDTPEGVDDEVTLDCIPVLDAHPSAQGEVTVIGREPYAGTQAWDSGANGAPVDSSGVHMFHQGGEPVSFVGDVRVKSGAAVKGSDQAGAEVSGTYIQGEPGTDPTPGHQCGLLGASSGGPVNRQLHDADAEGEPTCDDDLAKLIEYEPPAVRPANPDTESVALADIDTACAADVTELDPGYYGIDATKALNTLMASASCNNKTIHFRPGHYWFDAHPDPTAPEAQRFALVFPDQGSNYIFGPRVGNATSCDPDASDPSLYTSVTIGPYSKLMHLGGNLTICDGGGGNPADGSESYPALGKGGTAAVVGPQLGPPTNLNTVYNHDIGPFPFARAENATQEKMPADELDRARATLCTPLACTGNPAPGVGAVVTSTGSRPLQSLRVRWDSWEKPPSFAVDRRTQIRLLANNGAGPTLCTFSGLAIPERGRANGVGLEADLRPCLRNPDGGPVNPGGALIDESQLHNARLEVRFTAAVPGGGISCLTPPNCPRIEIWNLHLAVNEVEVRAKTATSSDWINKDGMLAPGEGSASVEDCTVNLEYPKGSGNFLINPNVCDRTATPNPTPKVFTLSDFEGWPAHWNDQTNIESVRLALNNEGAYNASDETVANATYNDPRLRLGETEVWATVDGLPCDDETTRVPWKGYTRTKKTYSVGLNCQTPIATVADVEQTAVTVAITPERNMFIGSDLYEGLGVELPQIDYARLVVESKDYEKASSVLFTVHEAVGNRVRVYGDTHFQLVNLDVHWMGAASDIESIFNGELKVNALSSKGDSGAEVGVVCCGPKYPNVLLTAKIGTDPAAVVRGVAQVFLTQNAPAPHKVEVADWELCHLAGCVVHPVVASSP